MVEMYHWGKSKGTAEKSHVYCPDLCISTLDKSQSTVRKTILPLTNSCHSKPITFQSEKEIYNRLERKMMKSSRLFWHHLSDWKIQETRRADWQVASCWIYVLLISASELAITVQILCLLWEGAIHASLCFAETNVWHIKSIKNKCPYIMF